MPHSIGPPNGITSKRMICLPGVKGHYISTTKFAAPGAPVDIIGSPLVSQRE